MHKLIIPEYPLCKVINVNRFYPGYFHWIEVNFPEFLEKYSWRKNFPPSGTKIYEVLGIANHGMGNSLLALLLDRDADLLIIIEEDSIQYI